MTIKEKFIAGLKYKNDDVKVRAAKEFKNFIVNELKDKTHDEMIGFIEEMFHEFKHLMSTNDLSDKKALLIALCSVADMDFVFSHNSFQELSRQIYDMSICSDYQINALKSRFLAQQSLISTIDKVESLLKESCSLVVDDTKNDAHKIYAALTFKDNALYASTIFFQYASKVIESLLIGMRDKQACVREACAIALTYCFSVTATREGIGRRRQKVIGTDAGTQALSNHRLMTSMSIVRQSQHNNGQQPANYMARGSAAATGGIMSNNFSSVEGGGMSSIVDSSSGSKRLGLLPTDSGDGGGGGGGGQHKHGHGASTGTTGSVVEWGENLYTDCINGILKSLDDVSSTHITSRKLNAEAWSHGTLLLLNELLKLSNSELEVNRLKLEEMMGMNLEQLSSNNSQSANVVAVRMAANMSWPYSNTEEHIMAHRSRIFHSYWCRDVVQKNINNIWPIVIQNFDAKPSYLHLTLLVLPRLIALDNSNTYLEQRLRALDFLQRCIKKDREKPLTFITLGLVAHVSPTDFETSGNLKKTMPLVKQHLPLKDTPIKKRQPLLDMSVYMLIGLIATGCREKVSSQINDMIQPMVDAGLSFPLIYSLKMVCCFIRELTVNIQSTLLKSLHTIIIQGASGQRSHGGSSQGSSLASGGSSGTVGAVLSAAGSGGGGISANLTSGNIGGITSAVYLGLLSIEGSSGTGGLAIAGSGFDIFGSGGGGTAGGNLTTYFTDSTSGCTGSGFGSIWQQPLSPLLTASVAPANITADQLDARNKILALRTLVEFEFDKNSLSNFVRVISKKLISFNTCPFKELRIEAVKTCAQLLTSLLGTEDTVSVMDRNTLNAVAEVMERLLIVSTSDPDPEVRLCVFLSLDERFDAYLAQQCHLSSLFIALHDEKFEIRKMVIRCLGRLSAINPSCLKPNLRKVLLQTLHELEYNGSSFYREQAAQLLAELVDTAPGFVQPYSEQLLLVLLPRIQSIVDAARNYMDEGGAGLSGTGRKSASGVATISLLVLPQLLRTSIFSSNSGRMLPSGMMIPKSSSGIGVGTLSVSRGATTAAARARLSTYSDPTAVQLAVLEVIKHLAVVAGARLKRHLDQLVPALIFMMQDSTALRKRYVAVATLCRLVTHTGYVVQPYRKYPGLLYLLLQLLCTEEVGSIRREVIKLLGTIGALDPFKLKLFNSALDLDSGGCDTGLVVSMHEVVDKKEVDMSQAELLVNVQWASIEDFYTACTLQSLIQLLREPGFRSYFDRICESIMIIFKSLGAKSVQYLNQILPEYFRCITEAPDNRQQEILLSQICFITDVVKLHLKQFMSPLVDILRQLWSKSTSLTKMCISVLQQLNSALGAEMKPFIADLVPYFQHTLCEEAEQSVIKMLELIPQFGYSLEESVHSLVPSIIKIVAREDAGARLEVKKSALDCLTRLADQLDMADVSGRIVHPVCRMLCGIHQLRYHNNSSSGGGGSGSISISGGGSSSGGVGIAGAGAGGGGGVAGIVAGNPQHQVLQSHSAIEIIPYNILQQHQHQPYSMTVEQLGELIPPAMDLLTTLLVKMRRRFFVMAPLVLRTIELVRVHFVPGSVQMQSIIRYNTLLNKVTKVSCVVYHDDDLHDYESHASKRYYENKIRNFGSVAAGAVGAAVAGAGGSNNSLTGCMINSTSSNSQQQQQQHSANTEHCLDGAGNSLPKFNSEQVERAWKFTKLISGEDWISWLRQLSLTLISQSPCPAIRACSTIGGCSAVLSRTLFNAAFVSCWPELTDKQQDELVMTLESVLHDCPSTEVTQAILNLEEFMSRCDGMKLPIGTCALASRALQNRVYAKALYYKEQEFLEETAKKGVAPQNLLFELLSINHKLQLEEAASGAVLYATRVHKEKLRHEEQWYERLQDWTRALNLYERKLEEVDTRRHGNSDLVLGRMRCLHALGDWNLLKNIGIERYESSSCTDKERLKLTLMLVNAAWALGDFGTMARFVESLPLTGGFEGGFLRAVIAVQREEFHEATELIQRARAELDSYLTAMAGESYIRAYGDLVEAQKLAELEEVIQYKLVRESRDTIRTAWSDRLAGCEQRLEDWRQLLQIRSLVLKPQDNLADWVKFAGLARRTGRLEMCRSVLETLASATTANSNITTVGGGAGGAAGGGGGGITDGGGSVSNVILSAAATSATDKGVALAAAVSSANWVRVEFASAKCMWATGVSQNMSDALKRLSRLIEERQQQQISAPAAIAVSAIGAVNPNMGEDELKVRQTRLLYAKCALRYGQWLTEKQYPLSNIIQIYKVATDEAPWMHRTWRAWAMANYIALCSIKSKHLMITKEMTTIAKRWAQVRLSLKLQKEEEAKRHQQTGVVNESGNNMILHSSESYTNNKANNGGVTNVTAAANTTAEGATSTGATGTASNTGNNQLPAEVMRMAQPQLRFSLLQSYQKQGNLGGQIAPSIVSFPAPTPHRPDSMSTFGQAAAVRPSQIDYHHKQQQNTKQHQHQHQQNTALEELAYLELAYKKCEKDRVTLCQRRTSLSMAAVRGFMNAVALAGAGDGDCQQLQQDSVRLVILLCESPQPLPPQPTVLLSSNVNGTAAATSSIINNGATNSNSSNATSSYCSPIAAASSGGSGGGGGGKGGTAAAHDTSIREALLSRIRIESWLPLLQQLLARTDTGREHVASLIVRILTAVAERHPQAVASPLVLAFKSGGSDRRRHNANRVLHAMELHSPRLVAEAFLLNEELIRLAISWMEMWTECLEDASRLFYEDKNVLTMFKILHPLHLLMERPVETLQEAAFFNEFAQDLAAAKNLCVRYESSNYKTDLTQAWEIYSNLYRKWSKQISNFNTIELKVASPILHDYTGWLLAVPGSYDPRRGGVVRIRSIRNCLTMMTSKQHPRKLTIMGDDGHSYMFLLKGHEDIRQDERAMQFFGLVNTLLAGDPLTVRRNLSIQRMSVIPLSTNTGLIGWVPNSDTLNALIREHREKTGVLLNWEHKEMLRLAPDYEKLSVIQKMEVFEAGIRDSGGRDGRDLARILWLKSHNAEAWFERRTNFIRSLAVMSIVGYILGLGDRHPSNIMLSRDSGKVIHIDFGDCFEVATMREKYPEKVPFRLTRMLINAMEVTGLEGVFRQTCVQLLELMQRHKESLLAVLEAFIHDPLLQWVLYDQAGAGIAGKVQQQQQQPHHHHQQPHPVVIKEDLEGCVAMGAYQHGPPNIVKVAPGGGTMNVVGVHDINDETAVVELRKTLKLPPLRRQQQQQALNFNNKLLGGGGGGGATGGACDNTNNTNCYDNSSNINGGNDGGSTAAVAMTTATTTTGNGNSNMIMMTSGAATTNTVMATTGAPTVTNITTATNATATAGGGAAAAGGGNNPTTTVTSNNTMSSAASLVVNNGAKTNSAFEQVIRIFTDTHYPDSRTLRNPYSVNQWRHHLCNGPWLGSYSSACKMRRRLPDGSIVVERNGLEGLIFSAKPSCMNYSDSTDSGDDWCLPGANNMRAMDVMRHIQNKLDGGKELGAGGSNVLKSKEHVDVLIRQAMCNYNLCQMYFGWCAFW